MSPKDRSCETAAHLTISVCRFERAEVRLWHQKRWRAEGFEGFHHPSIAQVSRLKRESNVEPDRLVTGSSSEVRRSDCIPSAVSLKTRTHASASLSRRIRARHRLELLAGTWQSSHKESRWKEATSDTSTGTLAAVLLKNQYVRSRTRKSLSPSSRHQ